MSNETQTVLDDLIASARDNGRYCADLPDMQRVVEENGYEVTVGRHFLIWLRLQPPEHVRLIMYHGGKIFNVWVGAFAVELSVKSDE